MKRTLLSLLLVVTLLSGCIIGSAATLTDEQRLQLDSAMDAYLAQDPIPKYDPIIDIHVVAPIYTTVASMETTAWLDLYRDYLGINLNYDWIVPGDQYTNRVNLAIADGSIPDIMPVSYEQLYQLIDANLIRDLSSAWEDGASALTKRYYERGGAQTTFDLATVGGKLYAIPSVTPVAETVRALYLRQDWLDKLGLEAPTTLDDMLAVLEAFASDDPDGNGVDDTYAMNLASGLWGDYCADLAAFANCYGAYPSIWIEKDGKVEYGGVQPEMKQVLAQLAKWYQKGYISSEFTMMDILMADDMFAQSKVGATFGTHIAMVTGGRALYTTEPNFEVTVVPLPGVSKDGYAAYALDNTNLFYVVNKDFAYPEALVKMLNIIHFFASTATDGLSMDDMDYEFWKDTLWMGTNNDSPWTNAFIRPETVHNNIERVLTVKKAMVSGDEADIAAANSMGLGRILYEYWDRYKNHGAEMRSSEDENERITSSVDWLVMLTNHLYEIALNVYQDNLQIDKRGSIVTDSMVDYWGSLYTLQLAAYTNIITGQESVDYYDTYVAEWYAMGGQMITDELNEQYAQK